MPPEVDVVLLSRDLSPPRPDVWQALLAQQGVSLHIHRVTGPRLPDDPNRWTPIVRARNLAKSQGAAPFILLLDDDVILDPSCTALLLQALQARPHFAALAADYAADMSNPLEQWDYPRHVAMGCTLFRRQHLQSLTFRWEPGKCECQCCCDDLRQSSLAIGYLPSALAQHIPSAPSAPPSVSTVPNLPGRILSAFDRTHRRLFQGRFLSSLRASGNLEQVTALAYGLRPSELRLLAQSPSLEVVSLPREGHPAATRLRDYQRILARWPQNTPVAHWDAGDVLFQAPLSPLWDLVRAHPDKLLAARESPPFLTNHTVKSWVDSIHDPTSRQRAFTLLSKNPVLNSGFAAGTARTMLRYLNQAHRLRQSPALLGSTDWGDQTALNLYCHSNPQAWLEIPNGWNYCLVGLTPRDFHTHPNGQTNRLDGLPLQVVHGNDGLLKPWDLLHTL